MTLRSDGASGLLSAARMVVGQPLAPGAIGAAPGEIRHSFAAVLFCLPVAALTRWLMWRDQGMPASHWHAIALDFTLFVIGWTGFLLLSRPVLAAFGEQRAWPRMVAVWNWCSVAQYGVLLGADLFALLGAGGFVLNVVGLVSLFWQTWIEWSALRPVAGSPLRAAALVALDFAIGVLIQLPMVALGG